MVLIEESAVCIAVLMCISKTVIQTHRLKLGLTVDAKMEIVGVNLSVMTAFELCLTGTEEDTNFIIGIDVSF